MYDRRRLNRWQLGKQAKIRLEGQEDFADCYVSDLNLKGLRLICAQKLERDKYAQFTLELDKEFSFEVEVWVAWHKAMEGRQIYGLYFSKIKDSDKERIYQFIQRYFPAKIKQLWWQQAQEREGGETMEEKRIDDRRVFARFGASLPVRFLNPLSGKEGKAEALDVCAKGIGLVTEGALEPTTPLELWLDVPDKGEPIYSRGKVVWVKKESANSCRAGINLERADLMGLSRVMRVR